MSWEGIGIILAFLLGIGNLIYIWRINKRTTFINSVTAERVKWIQKLRNNISKFCGRTYHWMMTQQELAPEEALKLKRELDELRMLIKLQLNPKGNYDKKIIRLIDEIPEHTDAQDTTIAKSLLQDMIIVSQNLLKEEWEKVKRESKEGDLSKQ
jgi:hypothetical protein